MEKTLKVFSELNTASHWHQRVSNSNFSVESSPIVGNSFTNSYKEWRDGTYENFKEWAIKQFGFEDLDSDDEAEVPVDAQKAKDIPFTMNKKGHIVVPNKSQYKRIRERQRVVRGYIGAVYSEYFVTPLYIIFSEFNHRGFHWLSEGSFSIHPSIGRRTKDIFQ
jgi:hypothetical protein